MNPFKVKKGLGRGLSSLIGDSPTSSVKSKLSIIADTIIATI